MISLFTGAGGLDLGLEAAGFVTRVAVEIDRWARETLEANRSSFRSADFPILDDIRAFRPEDILRRAGLKRGEAELVAGGPPCQSFSTAGHRLSLGDPRGSLFVDFAAVIAAAQPRFFIMENVRGLLSAAIKHRPLADRGGENPPLSVDEQPGSAFRIIRHEFEKKLKYQIVFGLVDAADYGVPQNRDRVIILGSRDREFKTTELEALMPPTHRGSWLPLSSIKKRVRGETPEFIPYSKDRTEILRPVPPGKNWRWYRDHPEFGIEYTKGIMGGAWDAGGGKVGFYRRLSWDKPSPTLPTSPIQKSTCLCHPEETRPLSVQEYAAIQQFPAGYQFAGSIAENYRQIGNAVPVGLGTAIGHALSFDLISKPNKGQQRLFERRSRYTTADVH